MPTPVRILEQKSRRLVLEAGIDRAGLACGLTLFTAGLGVASWMVGNDLWQLPLTQTCYMLLLDAVLFYTGASATASAIATAQSLSVDKNLNSVTVKVPWWLWGATDRYKLNEVIKLHHNRVDDGTFDKHSLLLIFGGGGALQFPPGGGKASAVVELFGLLDRFLGVNRSDAPVSLAGDRPESELRALGRRAAKAAARQEKQATNARVTVRWQRGDIEALVEREFDRKDESLLAPEEDEPPARPRRVGTASLD